MRGSARPYSGGTTKASRAVRIGALASALWFGVIAPAATALAQTDYPSRPVRIVTPLAAGSASDIVLRILAGKLSDHFNVQFVVQNQPGAGGVTADRTITGALPDGYTLGWVGNNNAIGVSLFNEAVDPRQDFRPIVGVSEFAYLFVTSASSPYKTLTDWIDAARGKPNTLTIGTSSAGTSNYLAALLFKSSQKLAVTVVPYRGPADLSVALLRNDVDLVVNAYGGLRPQIDAGKIHPLAVTSAARLTELPEVLTMAEAGVPDYVVTSWNSLYGPKTMPDQVVDVLTHASTQILNDPGVKARFKEVGFEANALPPQELDQRMRTEIDRWARVIADAGLEKQ